MTLPMANVSLGKFVSVERSHAVGCDLLRWVMIRAIGDDKNSLSSFGCKMNGLSIIAVRLNEKNWICQNFLHALR